MPSSAPLLPTSGLTCTSRRLTLRGRWDTSLSRSISRSESERSWSASARLGVVMRTVPETMTLATATRSGRPSVRTLLLREFDDSGFVFYTDYSGRKGRELAENPQAALVFYWPRTGRQVRVEGRVSKVSSKESDIYFSSRARDSQLSAWASQQSRVVRDRRFLEERVKRFGEKYPGRIPRPPNWGGYRLRPSVFEFWKERPGRLHDRLRYRRSKGRWIIQRLAP